MNSNQILGFRFDSGNRVIPKTMRRSKLTPSHEFFPERVGWHCQVTDPTDEFLEKVRTICPSAVIEPWCYGGAGSSGTAVYIHIRKESEASMFILTFGVKLSDTSSVYG